ncbi:MAG: PP2C family protein-serine/threonine phosphatase [Planctomycetota bacterium]
MRFRRVDPAEDPKVAELTELFQIGSTLTEPPDLLRHFGAWFGRQQPGDMYVSASRRGLPRDRYKITRLYVGGVIQSQVDKPVNPWRDWRSIEELGGGFVGEVLSLNQPQAFVDLDLADDPYLGPHADNIRSAIAVPIYDNGEGLNWSIWFFESPEPVGLDRLAQTLLDSNFLGMATKNLVERRRSEDLNKRLNAQLEQIAGIQQALLPQRLPKIDGVAIATSYLTSEHAGGDYYDFFPFKGGSWGVLIADVSGHGPAAATVMAMLRAILHCYDGEEPCAARVMSYVNDKLCESNLEGSFVTAFFAIYNPETRVMTYSRCGHNPIRLKRGDQVLELAGPATVPLGIIESIPVESAEIPLDRGDCIVMYTDGITEAMNHEREMFGVERFDAALTSCSADPETIIDSVHEALFAHTQVMDRVDDQTLVVFHVLSGEPANTEPGA